MNTAELGGLKWQQLFREHEYLSKVGELDASQKRGKNETEDRHFWVHILAPPLTKYVTGDK